MNTEFIQTLMANNEKAREYALKLNEEVGRLRQRETELTRRVIELLATKESPTEQEKAFVEWLVDFRMEADEPQKNKKAGAGSTTAANVPKADPRSSPYEASSEEASQQIEKLVKLRDELKLLSRVKKREPFPWIEARHMPTDAEMFGWETHKGVKLPASFKELYKQVGANAEWSNLDPAQSQIHRYSPFLALLPLDQVGWTEVWGQDFEPEEGYQDDAESARVLEKFEAGHEFDDSFVCEQLCGKDCAEKGPIRVLLVGAPINIKVVQKAKATVVNSRMFLNIRPTKEPGKFLGDGMLYRLDCTHSHREEGDSELVKIGTPFQWMENCLIGEVEDRLRVGGEKDPLVQRYPWVVERCKEAKKPKMSPEESEETAT